MKSGAKTKRRQWDSDDLKILARGAKKRLHARMIAKELKRHEGAVRQKAYSLGLSLSSDFRQNPSGRFVLKKAA